MTACLGFAYRCALQLLPSAFRRAYGGEMREIFEARLRATSGFAALHLWSRETIDVAATAVRVRLDHSPTPRPALVGMLALAMVASVLTLRQDGWHARPTASVVTDSIDFSAIDPAGEFTLTIRAGRPVSATIDRVPLPGNRLVQRGDSIRFLDPDGDVLLSVAYDRRAARIAWEARSPGCRGQASDCRSQL